MKTNTSLNNTETLNSLARAKTSCNGEDKRVPWTGGYSEDEMKRPGGLLTAALLSCANERRQHLNVMSRELGVSYGYINHLRSGIRQISNISDKFTLACARYLGVPRLTVLMLSGKIAPTFFSDGEEMNAAQIEQAMSFIFKDPAWGPLFTYELRQCSLESKYCLARLFEKATKKVLMDEALSTDSFRNEINRFSKFQAERAELVLKSNTKNEEDES